MLFLQFLQESSPEVEQVIQLETAIIVGLALITFVALLARRIKIPYTVALVVAGLLLTLIPGEEVLQANGENQLITSKLILALFVPPLVFEGALHINWRTFRANLLPIVLMAVFGVLVGTLVTGGVTFGLANSLEGLATRANLAPPDSMPYIPLAAAMAFGALISATDPVAVIAFFRRLGVNQQLSVLIEGESLLNDGTSIVIFTLALIAGGVAVPNIEIPDQINTSWAVWEFIKVSAGGILFGLIIAKGTEFLFVHTDDRLVETTITMPAAFGAYLLAEEFYVSGILAVVAAGIYLGNIIPRNTSPTTKIALYNYWEMVSFIFTSMIFLLIGWITDINKILRIENLILILSAIVAVILSRAFVVYGMSAASKRLGASIPRPYQHVMFWGGMRGAISLALALSLTANDFGIGVGEQLRLMTFGVVLIILLVQGTTIEPLIKHLGLAKKSSRQMEKELRMGQYFTARAAQQELGRLHQVGVVSGSIWEAMSEAQQAEMAELDHEVRDMLHRYPSMSSDLAIQARQAMLRAERTSLAEAVQREIISEDTLEKMLQALDARTEVLEALAEQGGTPSALHTATHDEEAWDEG